MEGGFLHCLLGRALGEDALGSVLLLHHQVALCVDEDPWQALTLDHVHLHFAWGAGLSLMTNVDEDHYCALEVLPILHVGDDLDVPHHAPYDCVVETWVHGDPHDVVDDDVPVVDELGDPCDDPHDVDDDVHCVDELGAPCEDPYDEAHVSWRSSCGALLSLMERHLTCPCGALKMVHAPLHFACPWGANLCRT